MLYISREDDRDEVQRRVAATLRAIFPAQLDPEVARLLVENFHVVDLVGVPDVQLDDVLLGAIVERVSMMHRPGLIILDPLAKFLPVDSPGLNTQEGAAQVHTWIDRLVQATGCTVLVAHHVNKTAARDGAGVGASTGSQLLEDLARVVLTLNPLTPEQVAELGLDGDSGLGHVELRVTKTNYTAAPSGPQVFRRVEGGALVPVSALPKADVDDERALLVLEAAGRGLTRDEWRKALKELEPSIPRDRADAARTRLMRRGLVETRKPETPNEEPNSQAADSTPAPKKKAGATKLVFAPTAAAAKRDRRRFDGVPL